MLSCIISLAQSNQFLPKEGSATKQIKTERIKNSGTTIAYDFLKDYEHMSDQVKAKINYNKINGLKLSDGVYKIFKANVNGCSSTEVANKIFSFLKTSEGFISTKFISNGTVQFIVVPETNSVDFKEKLLSKNLKFNFLSEQYILK
jgi:hypothetical protein